LELTPTPTTDTQFRVVPLGAADAEEKKDAADAERLARVARRRSLHHDDKPADVSFLVDAKSFLGDAKTSLSDAKSSLGDAESSLGDTKSSLSDAKSSLGE
jgi:hypothetical protein